ncbi:hypothetical protein AB0C24_29635 [Amycolatopsis japonica]
MQDAGWPSHAASDLLAVLGPCPSAFPPTTSRAAPGSRTGGAGASGKPTPTARTGDHGSHQVAADSSVEGRSSDS